MGEYAEGHLFPPPRHDSQGCPCRPPPYSRYLGRIHCLLKPQILWALPWSPTIRIVSYQYNPVRRINLYQVKSHCHMLLQLELAFTDYAGTYVLGLNSTSWSNCLFDSKVTAVIHCNIYKGNHYQSNSPTLLLSCSCSTAI